jgi:hypothetical protein
MSIILGLGLGTVGAGLGGTLGFVSTANEYRKANAELKHNKANAWKQYELGKANSDAQFETQKTAALGQLDFQEDQVYRDMDQAVGQFNTDLLAQAFGVQNAQAQTAAGIGASVAAEGAGGTRGNAANDIIRAYAQNGLQQNIDLQERQNHEGLDALGNQVTGALAGINQERFSWGGAGYRTALKGIEDKYNLDMANLGQANFQWQANVLNDPFSAALTYGGNIFSGATTGWNAGMGLFNFAKTIGLGE